MTCRATNQASESLAASRRWKEAALVAKRLDARFGAVDENIVVKKLDRKLRAANPRIIVWPFGVSHEQHQDHRALDSAMRNILKRFPYGECAWLVGRPPRFEDSAFQPNLFISYGKGAMTEILQLMACYNSEKGKDFAQPQFHRYRAGYSATQGVVSDKFAEPFQLLKGIPPEVLLV